MKKPAIQVFNARQNNLKSLDLEIPLNQITVITGPSGSGKSSLAFDTLYAEGQRRYMETFSPYARQFMDRMDRPRVDRIMGIPPAIAVDRTDPVRTSRSTVGTMSEITDYAKLLFARMGTLYCSTCGEIVKNDAPEQIWRQLQAFPEKSPVLITFPYPVGNGRSAGELEETRRTLVQMGYDRILRKGRVVDLLRFSPEETETVFHVLADRLVLCKKEQRRVLDSLEQAFRYGNGRLDLWIPPDKHLAFSSRLECARCSIEYPAPTPNLFSFNSPVGACETCKGFGRTIDIDMDLVIPDRSRCLQDGAIKPWGGRKEKRFEYQDLKAFCRRKNIPMDVPFGKLKKPQQTGILEGADGYYGIRGFFNWLESRKYKMPVRVFLSRYRSYDMCMACRGTRFQPESLNYRIRNKTIADIYAMDIGTSLAFFHKLEEQIDDEATRQVFTEIVHRLQYLRDVGLTYLTLDRQSRTLSGGEVQRVALTSALGSSLVNTLYVLDEPSIGLHPRDNHRLIRILHRLRDLPNTVVIVEHDPDIIREADWLLDLGPEAGENGGEIMFFGPIRQAGASLTGQYLDGVRRIDPPASRRNPKRGQWLTVYGATQNNLQNIDVRIPLGLFVCITGVSGSGKSTLAEEILFKGIQRWKGVSTEKPGKYRRIDGLDRISDIVFVDQRPIGRTPRANALTYTRAMDGLRKLFAQTPAAQKSGKGPGAFSFNVPGGRCEVCKGEGFEKVEMQFLSDVYVTCNACLGKRFTPEVLDIRIQGKNIHDILEMTVDQALAFFRSKPGVERPLAPLAAVGLGYLRLGQPISTLSGGESQRLKLSRYLQVAFQDHVTGSKLFLFDEPTTGLHLRDTDRLLETLRQLVEQGHTVVVVEHNMDLVQCADWVIDLGPEGGDGGGRIVAEGPPEAIICVAASHTGRFLAPRLNAHPGVQGRKNATRTAETREPYSALWPENRIRVQGARHHNLQNLDMEIPHGNFVVFTGVSGSGKSTLAFDIIFAEGQRRYLESLAPYVRQYMKVLERPNVDLVTGLSPTVAIEQRVSHAGRRSTVATLTEIYHFLRLLYSKVGLQHCPGCRRPLRAIDPEKIVQAIGQRFRNSAVVLAPKVTGRKGFHKDVFSRAMKGDLRQARVDGRWVDITEGLALSRYHEHTIELVVGRLPNKNPEELVRRALVEGRGSLVVHDESHGKEEIFSTSGMCPSCGISLEALDPRLFSFNSPQGSCTRCRGIGRIDPPAKNASSSICPACGGSRLRPEALSVRINKYSIWDIVQESVKTAGEKLAKMTFPSHQQAIVEPILRETESRLDLLDRLGLGYLTLSRSGETLSGGEGQRVRLAAQLGSNLTGITYVLDEPTIGLHPKDNRLLIDALHRLKDRGNTVLVVEHDEETIRSADRIVDLGPGAGRRGGQIVAQGNLTAVLREPLSVTGALLDAAGSSRSLSRGRPYASRARLSIRNARVNNLQKISADLPLGCLICVTGVSGSGKSSFLDETVFRMLDAKLHGRKISNRRGQISGWEKIDRVLEVDHSPIGRTPRSVPASYAGLLGEIRDLFARTPAARARGYTAGRFSFNVEAGRCPACKGQGVPKVVMNFLPDVYVTCDACRGRRYNEETLAITYRGQNIAEVLEMTFAEALLFFSSIPAIRRSLQFVCDIGLGYLPLGQPSPTLSGGEAQRMKLARQLVKQAPGHALYILDEPTTGLHMADVQLLIEVLQRIVDADNTVAVIEHNLEFISAADYIVDLGPDGGDGGGRIVAAGSPEEILETRNVSHTAMFLHGYLKKKQ